MLIPVLTLAALGMLAGIGLGIAAKVFAVKVDPRVEQIEVILPAYNCGACGYAGCSDYAKAVVDGQAVNLCSPGGPDVVAQIASIMGAEVTESEKEVAFVMCGGTDSIAKKKYVYNGVADCFSADLVGGGDKACEYGCLGLGSCVKACNFNAIKIEDGVAVVIPENCTGCKACVKACPKNIIKMVPISRAVHVACSSQDKGPATKKACGIGCIGCKRCVKDSPDAFEMDGNVARVKYDFKLQTDSAAKACPQNTIKIIQNEFTLPIVAPEPESAAEEESA